ncbi:DRTGG domain-containing protein [Natranaerobius thermophilus]|uniref:Putative signal-transduction protein with CBS and DRTGG domains n=1 Tax=Natranaerobius thermophilus (strain ATCC BAA-1301 / DSM 18059 / JW/NM-WN-LF) TaxID=457570 RepID=B2A6D1_NATTJ|nr:DRTGG domain-containing protein [Natranaerobius thermophilus]ACB84142.1 putative signal-transduction protein with CBS and DRTGG domains [Natranaerobius thermophilus JW/NM-WN-LF]
MTKHRELIKYISELPIGTRISVRKIAGELSVSDGTAYRAIKDAENKGLVTTIPKTGTIRIKNEDKNYNNQVTFAELIKIVNGTVLGGREGLYKPLNKFLIGAMKLKDISSYISDGCVLIVGNREEAHELALKKGAAVLISGGFETTEANKKLADKYALPIIKSPYDTYKIATLINQTLYNKMVESEILHVKDIINNHPHYLNEKDTYQDWEQLLDKTEHSRFPVTNDENKVVGVVTSKDVTGRDYNASIAKLMTSNPITVSPETLVASVAYVMVWQGIEMIPVVDEQDKLIGIVSRHDVMEAMQFGKGHDKNTATAARKMIQNNFTKEIFNEGITLSGFVNPAMTDQVGSMDPSILTALLIQASLSALGHDNVFNIVLENCSFNYVAPIQLEQKINVTARVLENSRKYGKVDLEIKGDEKVLLKGFISCQILKK